MVLRAQQFINSYTVPGIPKVEENGTTSWTVMYALTRALQYELGITTLSDNFGPQTLATLAQYYPVINGAVRSANICRILASGLYCKGYDGGGIDGTYNAEMAAGVDRMKQDMGVGGVYPDGVTPKVFKAALTMDAYVLIGDGSALVRSVQQWLNGYVTRRNFFIIPCDGHFSRDVQKGLMYAIQYTIGMSDDVANGVFGPGTQAGIRANTLSVGSSGTWVQLFRAAMIFNQRPGVPFGSTFDDALGTAVRGFQGFVALPVTGRGDFQTWASLLVSCGDSSRVGTACDAVEQVTDARAETLRQRGYRVVGRYLSNVAGSSLDKMLHPGEPDTIAEHGLRVFPIYQLSGDSAGYFNYSQGMQDAYSAIYWTLHHGFLPGTRIYFSVDFDALDYQVTDNVIPHFTGIRDVMAEHGQGFLTGIYAPRNVCSRVAAAGLSSASFVSDMSTGFSGNLGYPMPADWAFDQISTTTLGSSPTDPGLVDIDNNIASGRDPGQGSFTWRPTNDLLDGRFDSAKKPALLADVQTYLNSIGVPEKILGYTVTQALDLVVGYDWLFTELARSLEIRKALIESPVLWEMVKLTPADAAADALVEDHYAGGLSTKTDSSTGLGQIFAATAISSRNYCIGAGIISGTTMDPASEADLWPIWQKLHGNDQYNISTVPPVLIAGAHDIGIARPGLSPSLDDTRRTLARYNGTGSDADEYGHQLLGLYQAFEKYYALERSP